MQIETNKRYAVLTGDIVDSRRLPANAWRALGEVLDRLSVELSHWPEVPLPLARFRGDGWQLLVADPSQSLKVALYIRATLRAEVEAQQVDTRIAIGVGRIDPLPGARVSEGTGAAFWLSGAALDKKGWQRLRFAAENDGSDGETSTQGPGGAVGGPSGVKADYHDVEIALGLVDAVAWDWTGAQCRAVCGALLGWTQERTAAEWRPKPISQQGVAHHLSRAHWDAVQGALEWFEKRIQASKLVNDVNN